MSANFETSGISVNIKTDGKEVVSTGVVHAFGDHLEFSVSTLKFKMKFIDRGGEEQNLNWRIEDDVLVFDIVNFNNPLGVGSVKPMEIGFLNSRKLYISFIVSRMNETRLRRVEYTFYLGEAYQ